MLICSRNVETKRHKNFFVVRSREFCRTNLLSRICLKAFEEDFFILDTERVYKKSNSAGECLSVYIYHKRKACFNIIFKWIVSSEMNFSDKSWRKEFFMHMWNLNKFVSSLVPKKKREKREKIPFLSFHNRLEAKKKLLHDNRYVFLKPCLWQKFVFLATTKKRNSNIRGKKRMNGKKKERKLDFVTFFTFFSFSFTSRSLSRFLH